MGRISFLNIDDAWGGGVILYLQAFKWGCEKTGQEVGGGVASVDGLGVHGMWQTHLTEPQAHTHLLRPVETR